MSSLMLSPLAAQTEATANATRGVLIVVASLLLVLALRSARLMFQPLNELLRTVATALVVVLLIVAVLTVVVGALILSLADT
ncbi:hypothetical protein DFJ67_7794 [Asanoa ferruginea]|uniref:Uncharacterized protein n=1 Tax=Asanoa ferruginea TaxID=53367 RepID=A0A3D9ZWW3_9ACTN|nr:hypothetical protein [Asanoa ferruginea]REG01707.1 hypothetical protein DFJ67_7794 [Asanoa ferruginea]GIF49260.1 hypothetical protein Afe04nite_37990 [Asanoa ferruginea]